MELKVGDIIYHSSLGLMTLTKERNEDDTGKFSFKIHGKALFSMERLLSQNGGSYTLYQSSVERYRVRLATEAEIEDGLTDLLCSYQISDDLQMDVQMKDRRVLLSDSEGDNCLSLNEEELKALREKLNEILLD